MSKQVSQGKRWYAIHTYSGYEENVARNLKQRIESFKIDEKIFNVIVPKETKIKIKNGKRKNVWISIGSYSWKSSYFLHPDVPELVNLQNVNGKSKPIR